MISEEDAAENLRVLAQPTLDAFNRAGAVMDRMRDAGGEDLLAWRVPKRGLFDGVGHWAGFASYLEDLYDRIGGVERMPGLHSFRSVWLVGDRVRLHLKSDVHAFDSSQLSFEDLDVASTTEQDDVILTWNSTITGEPRFVHIVAGSIVWSRSVASLNVPVEAVGTVRPERAKSTLASKKSATKKTVASDEAGGE